VVLVVVIAIVIVVVLHMRKVVTIRNPFSRKDEQPVMKMTNAESQSTGINNPYGQTETAKHFDPVVVDGEFV
jgi:phosphopantetheine adenylyltransferase